MQKVTRTSETSLGEDRKKGRTPPPPSQPLPQLPQQHPKGPRPAVRDYDTPAEGREIDMNANIYSLIRTVDFLENARNTESVPTDVYADKIRHYLGLIESSLSAGRYASIDDYLGKNAWVEAECVAGLARVRKGCTKAEATNAKAAAEITQVFITIMDSARIEMTHVDDLLPYLMDLDARIGACPGLGTNYTEGRMTIKKWVLFMSKRDATYQLNDDEKRQFLMEMELAYNEFHNVLDRLK